MTFFFPIGKCIFGICFDWWYRLTTTVAIDWWIQILKWIFESQTNNWRIFFFLFTANTGVPWGASFISGTTETIDCESTLFLKKYSNYFLLLKIKLSLYHGEKTGCTLISDSRCINRSIFWTNIYCPKDEKQFTLNNYKTCSLYSVVGHDTSNWYCVLFRRSNCKSLSRYKAWIIRLIYVGVVQRQSST